MVCQDLAEASNFPRQILHGLEAVLLSFAPPSYMPMDLRFHANTTPSRLKGSGLELECHGDAEYPQS